MFWYVLLLLLSPASACIGRLTIDDKGRAIIALRQQYRGDRSAVTLRAEPACRRDQSGEVLTTDDATCVLGFREHVCRFPVPESPSIATNG